MLAIHPNSFGPNHSTMTIGAVAMLPVPESVSILRLLFVSGTLRYAAVTALSSRNPRWIGSCGPLGRFRDRWLQDELSDLEANQENNGIFNPTVAHHKHEHPGSSAGMFAHVFQWIPAELQENYFAEILLQLHTYAWRNTVERHPSRFPVWNFRRFWPHWFASVVENIRDIGASQHYRDVEWYEGKSIFTVEWHKSQS